MNSYLYDLNLPNKGFKQNIKKTLIFSHSIEATKLRHLTRSYVLLSFLWLLNILHPLI